MMIAKPATKYQAMAPVALPDRQWPSRSITRAPRWLSTDLRDGNQALFEPMNGERKMKLFMELVRIGFKEIEVGFPAASQTDFDFVRRLIDEDLIPEDVTLMVMTQSREDLIARTVEAVKGAPRAIVHLYNATAPAWRRMVFGMNVTQVMQLITHHVGYLKQLTDARPETQWTLQYSPETFSATELHVSLKACQAAIAAWNAGPGRPIIINLPTTVENATPNVFADQIEWMDRHLSPREHIVLSVHTHNDRGTGVAATELGLLAGADRVEGCLFGNGERTGNVDLVTVALNMYTQGLDPQLDFSDIDGVRKVVEECNQIPVHPRHPYVGDLVHTAFSGSHQDAIRKGFAQQKPDALWEVPYLPIDPADIGRSYEAVIRVNSQSGKGGIAYLLEQEYGISLPRRMQIEFSQVVQRETDRLGLEMTAQQIHSLLHSEYLQANTPYALVSHRLQEENGHSAVDVEVSAKGAGETNLRWSGKGNGALEALVAGLPVKAEIMDYNEHAIGAGTNAKAAAYIELRVNGERAVHGVGIDENITTASFKALFSALNRALSEAEAKAA